MAKRLCKNGWLREYIDYTKHSEAPDVFHFWTGVSVIAGALRRRVWIDQRYFQWTPNFYIFFVAPPGIVSKSTTAAVGMKLLRQIDGVKFGPDCITWQALTQSLASSQELVQMDDGLMYPMACLTIVAGELGTFFNPQDREMVDVLVSLWDGQLGVWKKKTKTQGEDVIENPWLNIIGCTTPSWLAGNFPEYMIGGGFTSRSIFIFADKKRQFIAYPAEVITPEDFAKQEVKLVHDLDIIADMRGEYILTEEATKWGVAWYEEHWSKRPEFMASDRYAGYIARKQTHIHKLAMVLAASSREGLSIEQTDLECAAGFMTELEVDMNKVFQQVGTALEGRQSREILGIIKQMKKLNRMELWRMVMSQFKGVMEFDGVIQGLINAGYVRQADTQDGMMIYYLGGDDEQKTN